MKNTAPVTPLEVGISPSAGVHFVSVLVVYEDDACREWAMRAEAHLVQGLGESIDLRFSWWKLRFLFDPRIMQLATEALGKAAIVLFSMSRGSILPLVVKAWIEAELSDRGRHQCSVLALLEAGDADFHSPSPAQLFLAEVAGNNGLDFLSKATALPRIETMRKTTRDGLEDTSFSASYPRRATSIVLAGDIADRHVQLAIDSKCPTEDPEPSMQQGRPRSERDRPD